MLDYNVPGGKLNRGLAVGDILLHLTKDVSTSPDLHRGLLMLQISPLMTHSISTDILMDSQCHICFLQASTQQLFEANVLGWCIEWVSLLLHMSAIAGLQAANSI